MLNSRKPLMLVALYLMVSTVLSSHFRGGIIMVRPVLDEDLRGSGEGLPVVMPTQVYHVSNTCSYRSAVVAINNIILIAFSQDGSLLFVFQHFSYNNYCNKGFDGTFLLSLSLTYVISVCSYIARGGSRIF